MVDSRDLDIEGVGMTSRRTRERLIARLAEKGITDRHVLETLLSVPRHIFVEEALAHRAYEDNALPIGHGQTISQPYIVALMTEALLAGQNRLSRVLEIGSGSGYQTAVLAQLADRVFAIERVRALVDRSRQTLRHLKLHNISLRHGDGASGWQQHAPYDGILCAAAPHEIPAELLAQLGPDGRLVMPLGGSRQSLCVIQRQGDSEEFAQRKIADVKFVPFLPGVQSA